jgi:hypothetical protein
MLPTKSAPSQKKRCLNAKGGVCPVGVVPDVNSNHSLTNPTLLRLQRASKSATDEFFYSVVRLFEYF